MTTAPALYSEPLPESEQSVRSQLIDDASAYFTAVQTEGTKDYKAAPLAPKMNRFENGVQTTNVPVMGNPAMSGAEQLDKGIFKGLVIDHRRFPVVDEEHGVVVGLVLMHANMNGQDGRDSDFGNVQDRGQADPAGAGRDGQRSERLRHRLEMSLSRRMVRAARTLTIDQLPAEVIAKVKIGLLDFLSCAFEARDLPWGCQAIRMAGAAGGKATVIGTPVRSSPAEAAFANATLGHGLVREDMHTGAVSHLGVVIFPALLALAQQQKASGRDFILGAVCGYEIGAAVGRAIMDQEMVRRFRPTGITGPLAGAIAGSRLLALGRRRHRQRARFRG